MATPTVISSVFAGVKSIVDLQPPPGVSSLTRQRRREWVPRRDLQILFFRATPQDVLKTPPRNTWRIEDYRFVSNDLLGLLEQVKKDTRFNGGHVVFIEHGEKVVKYIANVFIPKDWFSTMLPSMDAMAREAFRRFPDNPHEWFANKGDRVIPTYRELLCWLLVDTIQDLVRLSKVPDPRSKEDLFNRLKELKGIIMHLDGEFKRIAGGCLGIKFFCTKQWRTPIQVPGEPAPVLGQHRISSRVARMHGLDPEQFAEDAAQEFSDNVREMRRAKGGIDRALDNVQTSWERLIEEEEKE
ncbi:hypothetical protein JCM8547_009215 [Rhodosporidiobolus lusitaniae]